MPLILMAPAVLTFCLLSGYPIVRLVVNSFQKYGRAQLMGVPPEWVGGTNYAQAITNSNFPIVFVRTFVFMVIAVTLTIVLGSLVAMLMMKLNKFFRLFLSVGLLLAWAIPPLTAVIVWGWMIDSDYGVINYSLTQVGGTKFVALLNNLFDFVHRHVHWFGLHLPTNWMGHQWLLNPVSFFAVLIVIIVWSGIPFIAFTVYAALTGIPGEVKEAAAIDQAGPVRRFFLIELPYVRSVFLVLIVLSVIWDLTVFTQVVALQSSGGLAEQTSTLGVWIYNQGSASGNIGLSSAAAVIMVILMLAISILYVRQTLNEGE